MTIEEIENQLKSGVAVEGSFAKDRVMNAVAAALAEPRTAAAGEAFGSAWPWVLIVAAVIVAMNFAVIGEALRRFAPRPAGDAQQISVGNAELESFDPNLTPADARRAALLAAAGANLLTVPTLISTQIDSTPSDLTRLDSMEGVIP